MRLTQSDERARKKQFELDQERATSSLTNQVAESQSQTVDLCRNRETLLGIIDHCSLLPDRKRQRTDDMEEGLYL
uniref:Uncharacterized protein n=1 Tax=Hyaloperonospora arabidopsidis (strain Emoy2) TaxID=559515 RepID=M4B313_HYAAE